MAIDPDADLIIRTVAGEAGDDPDSQAAVAAVILNRAKAAGIPVSEVIKEPGAFEAWSDPKGKARIDGLKSDGAEYDSIMKRVAPVLAGQDDPTGGATYFYAPKAQAALGRKPPTWDDGSGADIGAHRFFKRDYAPSSLWGQIASARGHGFTDEDIYSHLVQTQAPEIAEARAEGFTDAEIAEHLGLSTSAAPADAAAPLPAGGSMPFEHIEQHELRDIPGAKLSPLYYHTGAETSLPDIGVGLGRGLRDLADTGLQAYSHVAPADSPDKIAATVASERAARDQFDQTYRRSPYAQTGRFVGSAVGTGALLAAGGEVLAPLAEAGSIGEFLAGAYKGNKLLQLGSRATAGAASGAAATGLNSSASDEPVLNQVAGGALTGATLGAGLPAVASGLGTLRNKLTGAGVDAETARLADLAINKYKLPLRAGQISNAPAVRLADSVIERTPFSGYSEASAAQRTGLTRAVGRTFGADADALTPPVMAAARKTASKVFEDVGARTDIANTKPLVDNLNGVIYDASQVLRPDELVPLQRQLDNIQATFQPAGELTGKSYLALRAHNSPLDRLTQSSDPNVAHYATQLREMLDDAFESAASKEDLASLKGARAAWRNMKTVQPLVAKAPTGEINPALLLGRMAATDPNFAYGGGGELGDLARIGNRFLKPAPSSFTPERMQMMGLLGLGGGSAGLGWATHNPDLAIGAAAGSAGALAGTRLFGAVLNNPLYRNGLIRSGLRAGMAPGGSVVVRPANRMLSSFNDNVALPAGVLAANRLLTPPAAVGR